MAKKYNLFSKSDMRKFEKDIRKNVMNAATNAMQKGIYDANCPHCGKPVKVKVGNNVCPYCRNPITFKLNINP